MVEKLISDQERPDPQHWGIGLDAGGTQTRWALANAQGLLLAEGAGPGLSALQMGNASSRQQLQANVALLARQILPALQAAGMDDAQAGDHGGNRIGNRIGNHLTLYAGLTGFGHGDASLSAALQDVMVTAFGMPAMRVQLGNDIEIAYHDAFAPGAGYMVYAGTGSIAALIDADGVLHRAGGRGYLLDDGGGGVWIAKEALRAIWRAEDEAPGCWQSSVLARAVFDHVGGSDWAISRQFLYAGERGSIGQLARAVAAVADSDAVALAILRHAGEELARLGRAMQHRFGVRPLALCGRVWDLHPLIEAQFRAAMPADAVIVRRQSQAHHAAAMIAARAGVAP